MGKLEKVIVLSVLFLIAVIVVASMTGEDPTREGRLGSRDTTSEPSAPLRAEGGVPATSPTSAAAKPPAPAATADAALAQRSPTPGTGSSGLLSAEVAPPASPEPERAVPAVAAPLLPVGSALKTLEGLEDSYLADMKLYTWKSGDTYRGLADVYYGDYTKLTLLRRANEGRKIVQPGEKIFVPVFDLDGGAAPPPGPSTAAVPATGTAGTTAARVPAPGTRVHVVAEGESLWKIAAKELGAGHRWNQIYELNRDVLSSPEALRTGMKLRLP